MAIRYFLLIFLLFLNLSISFSDEKIFSPLFYLGDNNVEFLLGYRDNIKEGEELCILRKGEKIGKIKVTKVGEYFSQGEIIELKENIKIESDKDMVSNFCKDYQEKKIPTPPPAQKKETINVQKKLLQERYITGKVLRVYENNLILVNLGKHHKVKENYEFLIIRNNNLVGKCKVTSDIKNYTCICEITNLEEGKEVQKGDKLLTTNSGIAPEWHPQ